MIFRRYLISLLRQSHVLRSSCNAADMTLLASCCCRCHCSLASGAGQSKGKVKTLFSPLSSSPWLQDGGGSPSQSAIRCVLPKAHYSSPPSGSLSQSAIRCVLPRAHYSSLPSVNAKIPYWLIIGLGGVLLLLGSLLHHVRKREEGEGDGTKVSGSAKRQLLKAERALQSGDYAKAEKACHSALGILMKSEHAENRVYLEARAVTMDKLANVYLEQRKWKEAEMLFKETLRVMIHIGTPEDDDAVLEISLKLAKIYHNEQRYEEAEVGFDWCVNTAREKWTADQSKERYALLGMCLLGRAQFHQMLGQHVRAVQDFKEIVDIALAMYGKDHLQVAVSYSNLATAVDASKDYNGAIELVEKGLEILKKLQASSEPTKEDFDAVTVEYYTAVLQANLGTIHLNNGEAEHAVGAYDEAERTAKKHRDKQLLQTIAQGRQKIKKACQVFKT